MLTCAIVGYAKMMGCYKYWFAIKVFKLLSAKTISIPLHHFEAMLLITNSQSRECLPAAREVNLGVLTHCLAYQK